PGQNGTIYVPTRVFISGKVSGTNGGAVAGISLQPSGMTSVISDVNGEYSVAVPLFWTGSVAPSGSSIVVPSAHNYASLARTMTNENYTVASPAAFALSSGQFDGTNVPFSWYGIKGVHYQPQYSSNLVDWYDYGTDYTGAILQLPSRCLPPMRRSCTSG